MSTSTTPAANGRVERKTLAQLLDKFDLMIDGLDRAIAEAVGDAVRSAVGAAVGEALRAAVVELATNPDLVPLLGGAPDPVPVPPAPKRPLLRCAGDGLAEALAWLWAGLKALGRAALAPPRLAAQLLGRLAGAIQRRPVEAALAAAAGGAAGWLTAGGIATVAGLGPRLLGAGRRLASRLPAIA
jgi:hypothetical protein